MPGVGGAAAQVRVLLSPGGRRPRARHGDVSVQGNGRPQPRVGPSPPCRPVPRGGQVLGVCFNYLGEGPGVLVVRGTGRQPSCPAGPRWLGTAALPLPRSASPVCVSCCRPRSPNRTGCQSIGPSLGTPWPVGPGCAVWCWVGDEAVTNPELARAREAESSMARGGGEGGEQSPSSTARTLEGSRQHKANLVPAGGSESILLQQRCRGPVVSDTPEADGFGGCVTPLVSISSVLTPGWLRRDAPPEREERSCSPNAWRGWVEAAEGRRGGGHRWPLSGPVCPSLDTADGGGLCHYGWVCGDASRKGGTAAAERGVLCRSRLNAGKPGAASGADPTLREGGL